MTPAERVCQPLRPATWRLEGDAARRLAHNLQSDGQAAFRKDALRFVGPLDYAKAVAVKIFVQLQAFDIRKRVQAVQVHVVKRQPRRVLGHQHKRGASRVLGAAQPPEHALGEASLARAQAAGQQEYIPRLGALPKRFADSPRVLGRPADYCGPVVVGQSSGLYKRHFAPTPRGTPHTLRPS